MSFKGRKSPEPVIFFLEFALQVALWTGSFARMQHDTLWQPPSSRVLGHLTFKANMIAASKELPVQLTLGSPFTMGASCGGRGLSCCHSGTHVEGQLGGLGPPKGQSQWWGKSRVMVKLYDR